MITTPSMGLKRWNLPNDNFSYTDLSDNFALLDIHDHTSGKGVQIPTAGIANFAIDSTKLANNAVTNAKIPTNILTGDRLQDATLADAKLVSANNSVWRTLQNHLAAGTSAMTGSATCGFGANGGVIASGAASGTVAMLAFPFVAAHYAVAGKTTKLRVLGTVMTNTVAPATNITLALNPVSSVGGAANNLSTTIAPSVAGSSVAVNAPSASSRNTLTGTEFNAPADGYYVLTVSASVAPAANSVVAINSMLQIRHV